MLLTRLWIMDKQMITMIEQNQAENNIEKQKQIDNLREKNTEISWKTKKMKKLMFTKPGKQFLWKVPKEKVW